MDNNSNNKYNESFNDVPQNKGYKKQNNNDPNGNNKNEDDRDKRRNQRIILTIVALISTFFLVSTFTTLFEKSSSEEITYTRFLELVDSNLVEKVVIDADGTINVTPYSKLLVPTPDLKVKDGNIKIIHTECVVRVMREGYTYWTMILSTDNLYETLEDAGVEFKVEKADTNSSIIGLILEWVVPFLFIYLIFGMVIKKMSKGGGGIMGNVGKSNAKVYVEKATGVLFKDVAGQEEAKESLKEIVDFLHNPGKYAEIGAKLPKGALLVGPPGTGKTLLAKAVAGEAKVPFFSLSGSDFVEMFVGVGASRVRDLFKEAQKNAPCIIFIDEIDAIGKSRDSKIGGNDEREQTLNQLLAEMDGFDSSKGILILAATNRPEILDKALLRPGRFDRRVIVDKPDLKGRIDTLKVHSKDVLMDDTVDLEAIGLATSGAVGSDLANMVNEAAINAVKHGRRAISQADLFEAVEVVIAGKEKKDRIMSPVEKKTVAYHEVGHALITALEKESEPVQKITIVPRTMGSLGYVMQVPEEEKYLMTKDELLARIVTLFGGRAAEEIMFNSVTTGASNDMEKATKLARAMVTQYGMNEKFGLMSLEEERDSYLSGRTVLNCSDVTAAEIDTEVKKLLHECYERAKTLISDNKEALIKIADYLYEKETITGKKFMEIYNKVKNGEDFMEEEEDKEAESEINEEVKEAESEIQISQEDKEETSNETEIKEEE